MSDPRGARSTVRDYSSRYAGRYGRGGGLTDYERRLLPIYREEEEAELTERRRIQPVRMIFDLLQRPQYASANTAREILRGLRGEGADATEVLRAIWDGIKSGIRGTEKTSYEDVIREHLEAKGKTSVAEARLFPNAPENTWRSQVDLAKLFGFLGDVFLDPTTYVGFGATGGAVKAASAYADDVAKVLTRELGERIGKEVGETGLRWGAQEVLPKSMDKLIGQAHKRAFREALRLSGEELRDQLVRKTGTLSEASQRGLSDLVAKLQNPATYEKAGYSGLNLGLFGRTNALEKTRPTWNRGMRAISRLVKENPGSSALSNAWWAIMNWKPIKHIRELVHLQNPYEKFVRQTELEVGRDFYDAAQGRLAKEVLEFANTINDDEMETLYRLYARVAEGDTNINNIFQIRNPEVLESLGIKDPDRMQTVWAEYKNIMGEWRNETEQLISEGVLGESASMGDILDYFPQVIKQRSRRGRRVGAGTSTGPLQQRVMAIPEHADIEASKWAWLTGTDIEEARELINVYNLADVEINLRDAMLARGVAQAKIETRANIVRKFREFGIPVKEMGPNAQKAFRHGIDDAQLGLKTIAFPGFDGLVFDYEVAKVAEHALNLTAPKNINEVQRLFNSFTAFWKRVVTMTPGFHARNFYSNEMTLFLKHGTKAMNPRVKKDAFLGVVYGLNKTDLKKIAQDYEIPEQALVKMQTRQYGNFTLPELVDEAIDRGVISRRLHGQDVQTISESLSKKTSLSPTSKDFVGSKVSRWTGEHVENMARFQSFLMDYAETASSTVNRAASLADRLKLDEEALRYASLESKKWFLDYGDLSDFEQSVLKNVIPFYSWLRKNIANQMSAVIQYPELFGVLPKLEEFFTYENPDYDPDYVPEWMKQLGMFPTGKLEDGSFRMFNPNFPYQDLNRLPLVWEEGEWFPRLTAAEARDDIVNAMHPAIRTFVSQVMLDKGYNFFYKEELGEDAPAPYLMRLFASNPGIVAMIDGLQREKGWFPSMRIDEEGKLRINAKVAQLLENNMPLLRWAETMFYLPADLVPGLGEFIEERTRAKDEYDGAEELLQFLSRWLGIKFKPGDIEAEKARVGAEIYYRSRDILNERNRDRPGSEIRRMQYQDRIGESIRRLRG